MTQLTDAATWLTEVAAEVNRLGLSMPFDELERAIMAGMYQHGLSPAQAVEQIAEARQ